MCYPASLVLTESRVLFLKDSDSHNDILTFFGIEDTYYGTPNFIKVEISPPFGDYSTPIENWVFRIDQDKIPDWYPPSEDIPRAFKGLEKWKEARTVKGKCHLIMASEIKHINNVKFFKEQSTGIVHGGTAIFSDKSHCILGSGGNICFTDESSGLVVSQENDIVLQARDNSEIVAVSGLRSIDPEVISRTSTVSIHENAKNDFDYFRSLPVFDSYGLFKKYLELYRHRVWLHDRGIKINYDLFNSKMIYNLNRSGIHKKIEFIDDFNFNIWDKIFELRDHYEQLDGMEPKSEDVEKEYLPCSNEQIENSNMFEFLEFKEDDTGEDEIKKIKRERAEFKMRI